VTQRAAEKIYEDALSSSGQPSGRSPNILRRYNGKNKKGFPFGKP